MRTKKTYESISFERGKDPKDAMKIGAVNTLPRIVDMDIEYSDNGIVHTHQDYLDADENTWSESVGDLYRISDVLEHWEDEADYSMSFWVEYPEDPDDDMEYWHAPEMEGHSFVWQGNIYEIPKTNKFKKIKGGIQESVNFKRGGDPKSVIGIGEYGKMYHDLTNHNWEDGIRDGYGWLEISQEVEDEILLIRLYKLKDESELYKAAELPEGDSIGIWKTPYGPMFVIDAWDYGIGFGTFDNMVKDFVEGVKNMKLTVNASVNVSVME